MAIPVDDSHSALYYEHTQNNSPIGYVEFTQQQ